MGDDPDHSVPPSRIQQGFRAAIIGAIGMSIGAIVLLSLRAIVVSARDGFSFDDWTFPLLGVFGCGAGAGWLRGYYCTHFSFALCLIWIVIETIPVIFALSFIGPEHPRRGPAPAWTYIRIFISPLIAGAIFTLLIPSRQMNAAVSNRDAEAAENVVS
ncbi:hypothetical protein BH11PLA2_BH11PLA2_06930 [soil metagenome]